MKATAQHFYPDNKSTVSDETRQSNVRPRAAILPKQVPEVLQTHTATDEYSDELSNFEAAAG